MESSAKTAREFINSVKEMALQTGAFSKTEIEDTIGNIESYLMREYDHAKIEASVRENGTYGFDDAIIKGYNKTSEDRKILKRQRIANETNRIRLLKAEIRGRRAAAGHARREVDISDLADQIEDARLEIKTLSNEMTFITEADTDIVMMVRGKILGENNADAGNVSSGTPSARIRNFYERVLDINV